MAFEPETYRRARQREILPSAEGKAHGERRKTDTVNALLEEIHRLARALRVLHAEADTAFPFDNWIDQVSMRYTRTQTKGGGDGS